MKENSKTIKFILHMELVAILAILVFSMHWLMSVAVVIAAILTWKQKFFEHMLGISAVITAMSASAMVMMDMTNEEQWLFAVTFLLLVGVVMALWLSESYKAEPYHKHSYVPVPVESKEIQTGNFKFGLSRLGAVPSTVLNVGVVSGYLYAFNGHSGRGSFWDFAILSAIIIAVNFVVWKTSELRAEKKI